MKTSDNITGISVHMGRYVELYRATKQVSTEHVCIFPSWDLDFMHLVTQPYNLLHSISNSHRGHAFRELPFLKHL
jgi:hypothetical protein